MKMELFEERIVEAKKRIQDADYIIIGAGAGLSSAAGFDYGGQRFEHYFHDFKEGWNPDTTLKTINVFANDIDNWGDGYLVIGAKEKNGRIVIVELEIFKKIISC